MTRAHARGAGVAAALLAGAVCAPRAHAGEDGGRRSILGLASMGLSRSLDPPVRNLGAPAAELRCGVRLSPRFEPDAGVAVIAFPDAVPALRAGVRVHPFGGRALPLLPAIYLRPGVHALLATGPGFEWAAAGEIGLAPETDRLIAVLALSASRVFRHPRVEVDLRAGFGFRF